MSKTAPNLQQSREQHQQGLWGLNGAGCGSRMGPPPPPPHLLVSSYTWGTDLLGRRVLTVAVRSGGVDFSWD